MMRTTTFTHFIFLLFALVIFSCTPQKKLLYLQGDASMIANDTTSFTLRLYPGDFITVDLYTVNPEAFPGLSLMNDKPSVTDNRSAYEKGFVIDQNGNSSLPYIGLVHLAGLSLTEAHDTLQNRFKRLIDEPVLVVKKISFKVSIVGEVIKPGLYYVPNEQITLIEALAMAGDLNNFGDRTNIKILRKTSTGTQEMIVDLTSKTAMIGANKFVYPDDIIYVSPTRKKAFSTISTATIVFTSILTVAILLANLYVNVNK
jgi:polysaccharide export outer membrane protein